MHKTIFLKNKKMMIISLVALLLVSFTTYGAVKISNQQKRISVLESNNTQEQEEKDRIAEQTKQQEAEAIQQAEQQKTVDEQKAEQQKIIDEQEQKNNTIRQSCENLKSSCNSKVGNINREIEDAKSFIKARERDIKTRNDIIDECNDDMCKKPYEDAIETHKKFIKEKNKDIDGFQSQINKLAAGECKGYQNPCE